MLRYKFSGHDFISPLTKYPHEPTHYSKNPHGVSYYPNILYAIGPSQILHTQAHKLPWALSQILPIISHISSKLNSPQIILIILLRKLGRKITQSPTSFSLWAKPKESPNSLKSHYDVANSKPATMRHYLQSSLLNGTSKACCYTTSLKPGTIRHL